MIPRLLCLSALSLLLPVQGGGEVMSALQEAEYRLAAAPQQTRYLRLSMQQCMRQQCSNQHGKALLECLQTNCDDVGVAEKHPNKRLQSGDQCLEKKCGSLSGKRKISCIMIHCYGFSVDETKALEEEFWPDAQETGGIPLSDWLQVEDGQPIASSKRNEGKGEDNECKQSCSAWPPEEFALCMNLRCQGNAQFSQNEDEPSLSLPGLLCAAKCRDVEERAAFWQCVQDQCSGSVARHVTKRWGTRICMESKCKHAVGKEAYFACGSRNCHGGR